jgi:type I restriction enzyme M protein
VAEFKKQVDLAATHRELVEIEKAINTATAKHNQFLKELCLSLFPSRDHDSAEE